MIKKCLNFKKVKRIRIKLFIDTAEMEIKSLNIGLIDGVTTNPSLIAKSEEI